MTSFLFVDQITALDSGKSIRGLKHVTASDYYLLKNIVGDIVFWPALIGETLGQLCAWNVMQAHDFLRRPVAGVSKAVHVFGDAKLGDTIELFATIHNYDSEAVLYDAVASVNGKPVVTLTQSLGPNLPMADFIDPTVARQQFQRIYRPVADVWQLSSPNATTLALGSTANIVNEQYDGTLAWQRGEFVTAYKKINLSAVYFADHFPRKPVLPLTVLMQCHMSLCDAFLADWLGVATAATYRLREIRRIKMTRFVQPGDIIVTTLKIKAKDDNTITVHFETALADKRIAVMDALFANESSNEQLR